MPTPEPKTLSEEQAQECLTVVRNLLGPGGEDAAIYPPGHEGPMWVVSLEGCGDWAVRLAALDGAFPADVFVEPVADWCLGLYPA